MSSFWWGQSALDELIEKATSELLPAGQVDLALHLEISDQIRSKKVNSKDAVKSLKQRLSHKNPNVILATLSLVDTCMKNSGNSFVKEVATRDFMEEMTHLIKVPTGCNQDVKQKVLYLIQIWGIASKGNTSLSYISGTYNLLRAEGYDFPPVTERIDSILLETAVAPEWTDSDCCERCRTSFTLTNRKHHCRQCGSTFCQQCSSKSIPLSHLGINDTVRVCDGCYIKVKLSKVADKDIVPNLLGNQKATTASSISSSLTPTFAPSIKNKSTTTTVVTSNVETINDQFEDDLKKAIEISLKESKEQEQYRNEKQVEKEEQANLAAAIAASLKDMESVVQVKQYNQNELSSIDMENIQLFSTLIQRVKTAGGDISGDNQINKLYTQIGALQPKLVKTLDETSQKHDMFVNLHSKLNKAVKAYDKLLEDRLSRSTFIGRSTSPYSQQQQQQFVTSNVQYPPATLIQSQQQYYPYPSQTNALIQYPMIPPSTLTQSYSAVPSSIPTQSQQSYPTTNLPFTSPSSSQQQQQYQYPSVPTTAPSITYYAKNNSSNYYYDGIQSNQQQQQTLYFNDNNSSNAPQRTVYHQTTPVVEEAPLIEL